MAYIVGAGMPLLPLHQEQLGHHQGSDKDEDHFSVHGFMAPVLGVHACMLDPESQTNGVSQVRDGVVIKGQCFPGISYQSIVQNILLFFAAAEYCANQSLEIHMPYKTSILGQNRGSTGPRHQAHLLGLKVDGLLPTPNDRYS